MEAAIKASAAIHVITRDRPLLLSRVLDCILDDLRTESIDWALTVVDDSVIEAMRRTNRGIADDFRSSSNAPFSYVSREEILETLSCSSTLLTERFRSSVGILGDEEYRPARARNTGRLLRKPAACEVLIDDDILIDGAIGSSLIARVVRNSINRHAFVSLSLGGVPDLSLLGLVEYVLVDGDDSVMQPWSKDYMGYHMSGGCLAYPAGPDLPPFPSAYNEDFLWIAYSSNRYALDRHKMDCQGQVKHLPDRPKVLTLERLIYEADGELLVGLLECSDMRAMAAGRPPDVAAERQVLHEYKLYARCILSLLGQRQRRMNADWLCMPQHVEATEILMSFLRYLDSLRVGAIAGLYERWMREIVTWPQLSPLAVGLSRFVPS